MVTKEKIKQLAKIAFNTVVETSDKIDYETEFDCLWTDEQEPSEEEQQLWMKLIKNVLNKLSYYEY